MDKWAVYKKCDDFRVAAPKSINDVIEIKSIAENGIFEVGKGGIFTKTYKFSDINYETASVDEQYKILIEWCRWLNSHSVPFKITVNNKNKNMAVMREQVLLPHVLDNFDPYRDMFNEEIEDNIKNGRQGIEQELYLTLRYEASPEYENARIYFATLENNMIQSFRELGSELTPLDATERLRILHDFYRFGDEEYFNFDFRQAVAQGFDFKEAIANSRLDFSNETYFKTDNKYCSCIYLKQLPGKLTDRFLIKLTKLPVKMMCSIDCSPMSESDTDAMLKDIYLAIEKRIKKQNKIRIKEMDFNSDISMPVQMDKEYIEKMIREKSKEDQHWFYTMLNIVVIADSLEELAKNCDLIFITAKNHSCIFDYSYLKQKEALNTILPVGVRQVSNGRNMQTKGLAALFPFNVQELFVPGGIWYGSNLVSKNLVVANRKKLLNPHGFIFGVTGSGKTTAGMIEMMQVLLNSEDDVIVVDPKNDYRTLSTYMTGYMGGSTYMGGAYFDVSANSGYYHNPLEYYDTGTRGNIADDKAELVLSICETCKREPLTAAESSIINRALKHAYNDALLKETVPTMTNLYESLEQIDEPEAKDVRLYLELFVTGSLNIFARHTNVNLYDNRLIMFGLKNMGTKLRDVSMLVMLECIKERIFYNNSRGKNTWLYIDEFHELLKTEYCQNYIKALWMLVRSLGGICTALTQNVTDVLGNDTTAAMLDNSEHVLILKQRDGARDALISNVGLSPEIVKYAIRESGFGKGILRSGAVTIPVSQQLHEDGSLYNALINVFQGKGQEQTTMECAEDMSDYQ